MSRKPLPMLSYHGDLDTEQVWVYLNGVDVTGWIVLDEDTRAWILRLLTLAPEEIAARMAAPVDAEFAPDYGHECEDDAE